MHVRIDLKLLYFSPWRLGLTHTQPDINFCLEEISLTNTLLPDKKICLGPDKIFCLATKYYRYCFLPDKIFCLGRSSSYFEVVFIVEVEDNLIM